MGYGINVKLGLYFVDEDGWSRCIYEVAESNPAHLEKYLVAKLKEEVAKLEPLMVDNIDYEKCQLLRINRFTTYLTVWCSREREFCDYERRVINRAVKVTVFLWGAKGGKKKPKKQKIKITKPNKTKIKILN